MDPAAIADDLSAGAARTLTEAVRCLALDHPDNNKWGFIKWTHDAEDGTVLLIGPDWDGPGPSQGQVNELVHSGCALEVEERAFQPTGLGRRVAAELTRRAEVSAATGVLAEDLAWQPSVVGHLQSIYDAWLAAGAPTDGINVRETSLAAKSEATVRLVLEQLQEGEFIRYRAGYTMPLGTAEGVIPDGFAVPTMITPLNATVAFFGGWPSSPQAAQDQLLAALDARLADPATSEQERGALQTVRDNVLQLAAGTVWTIVTGALGIPAA